MSEKGKLGFGKTQSAGKKCRRCKNRRGLISKYGMKLCRRCFKDVALQMGFKKFD
ncbi:MAG: 30S ribosomal protein S14 [Candidatus Diapherotrites archaeon]